MKNTPVSTLIDILYLADAAQYEFDERHELGNEITGRTVILISDDMSKYREFQQLMFEFKGLHERRVEIMKRLDALIKEAQDNGHYT